MPALTYVNPDGAPPPVGQYTNAAVIGPSSSTVYIAGQLAVDGQGGVIAPGDFDAQADAIFANVAVMLASVGSSMSEIAFVRSFIVRDADFPRLREARQRAFAAHDVADPPPATTVIVNGLYGGALLEIDVIAAVA